MKDIWKPKHTVWFKKNDDYDSELKRQKISAYDDCVTCGKEDRLAQGECRTCFNKTKSRK